MTKLFSTLLALTCSIASWSQECNCPSGAPEGGEVMKTYQFGNGITLGICGYSTVEAGDTTYTKFALFRCGEDNIIKDWTVNISCKLERTKDALMVKEMYNLPVGQSFSTLWRPFYVYQFTLTNGKFIVTEYFDKRLPKYSKEQIASVLKQYKELPQVNTHQTMTVANMLFWAAVSGSNEAEAQFNTMEEKYGPFAGVIGMEWQEIKARHEQWKSKKK